MIYFARRDGTNLVKIGFSKTEMGAFVRMRSFQTASPETITALAVVHGSREDEKTLHKLFRHHRKAGEWFSLFDHQVTLIGRMKRNELLDWGTVIDAAIAFSPGWCHGSCCSGETYIDDPLGSHDSQMLYDREGFPYGSLYCEPGDEEGQRYLRKVQIGIVRELLKQSEDCWLSRPVVAHVAG